jgi:hypothetical protein
MVMNARNRRGIAADCGLWRIEVHGGLGMIQEQLLVLQQMKRLTIVLGNQVQGLIIKSCCQLIEMLILRTFNTLSA